MTIANTITELEKLFEELNKKYFNGELEKPVITIAPDTTKGAYGWCTSWKAWKDGEAENYEINLCSEYLDRGIIHVAETLLHEMVHLDNVMKGIKDTSNNGFYHNKKYKQTAETKGLNVENDEKYGWCKTTLTEETKAYIESLKLAEVTLARKKQEKPKSKSKNNSIKYVCPCCGAIVRATKPVKIGCYDCDMEMTAVL
jgi:hypothetical protein